MPDWYGTSSAVSLGVPAEEEVSTVLLIILTTRLKSIELSPLGARIFNFIPILLIMFPYFVITSLYTFLSVIIPTNHHY